MTDGQLLFAYGKLQLPDVQLDTFGRLLDGEDDVLPGFTIDHRDLEPPHPSHPALRHTGDRLDKAVGRALRVTEDELDAADEFEVVSCRRISARLASGRLAWVYVAV